jgi:hypothetical protein
VQASESQEYLNKDVPNLVFGKELFGFLVLHDLLVEVPIVRKLHDDAE